jgi:hypothetical protein
MLSGLVRHDGETTPVSATLHNTEPRYISHQQPQRFSGSTLSCSSHRSALFFSNISAEPFAGFYAIECLLPGVDDKQTSMHHEHRHRDSCLVEDGPEQATSIPDASRWLQPDTYRLGRS